MRIIFYKIFLFFVLVFILFWVAFSEKLTPFNHSKKRGGEVQNPFVVLPQPIELKLSGLYSLSVGRGLFDASGLTFFGGELFTVNDKLQVPMIFRIVFGRATELSDELYRLEVKPAFFGGGPPPKKNSSHWKSVILRLDLEGVTHCGGQFFAVSEQRKEILRVTPSGGFSYHSIDFESYRRSSALRGRPVPPPSNWFNAGLEGVACDLNGRRLFVVFERQPRMIYTLKLPEHWENSTVLRPIDHFDLPSYGLPRKVGIYSLEPNFSGLDFWKGKLYVLYRAARLVLVVEPGAHRLLSAYSYYLSVKGLYRRIKPYGLAEGIAVSDRFIWIILDNNGAVRSVEGTDRRPVLLKFELPSR